MSNPLSPSTLGTTTVNSSITTSLDAPLTFPNTDGGINFGPTFKASPSIGTATGQIKSMCSGLLVANPTATIVLSSSGNLLDPLNNAVSFSSVFYVLIQPQGPINQTLTLKPGATHGISWAQLPVSGFGITPNNVGIIQDNNVAMGVSASSTDQIDIVCSSGACTLGFLIIGR